MSYDYQDVVVSIGFLQFPYRPLCLTDINRDTLLCYVEKLLRSVAAPEKMLEKSARTGGGCVEVQWVGCNRIRKWEVYRWSEFACLV